MNHLYRKSKMFLKVLFNKQLILLEIMFSTSHKQLMTMKKIDKLNRSFHQCQTLREVYFFRKIMKIY